jgi:sirohydrochlorin ferrochelatase
MREASCETESYAIVEQSYWHGKNLFGNISLMKMGQPPTCFLFDNGSLRAASTLSLRGIGGRLRARLGGVEVRAVSLLHSSTVGAGELGGERAELLEPALEAALGRGENNFVLLPLFFGPSAAVTEYVPERLRALEKKFPQLRVRVARWLVDANAPDDLRLAAILADGVRRVAAGVRWSRPKVVLVDHGSPQRGVAAVRDFLGGQLRRLLGSETAAVAVASMERRPEPAFAFTEPLLADLLRSENFGSGEVVVALQFLSPGRHAGPGGDIAEICAEAMRARPGLRVVMTDLVGADERLADVLADRYREAAAALAG